MAPKKLLMKGLIKSFSSKKSAAVLRVEEKGKIECRKGGRKAFVSEASGDWALWERSFQRELLKKGSPS